MITHRIRSLLRRFFKDARGSSDLNTYLLLSAAGCSMVVLTAPHLFNSSKTASNAFDKQVQVLERGASPGGGTSGGGLGSSGVGGLSDIMGGSGGSPGTMTNPYGGGGPLLGGSGSGSGSSNSGSGNGSGNGINLNIGSGGAQLDINADIGGIGVKFSKFFGH